MPPASKYFRKTKAAQFFVTRPTSRNFRYFEVKGMNFRTGHDLIRSRNSRKAPTPAEDSVIIIVIRHSVVTVDMFTYMFKGPRAGPGPLGPRAPGILPPLPPPLDGPGNQDNYSLRLMFADD
ncbi:unnamed protein product [Nesidiocoris tenuis]|uniref:Uncharacterized protein n=1 Tax=Nesidiocoris tenuis TaxID=355587 RepID=A0A6H5GQ29_9HEMI|nr:unnamed protein product [Nesidiocoris tenuis]